MTQQVSFAHQIIVVIRLTIREARRRRMLWLGLGLGLVFVGIYAAGLYFAWTDFTQHGPARQGSLFASIFLSAGLYVVNFLVVMVTALTTVGTISGEIDTATIHAIAAKPIRRWEIILGKWIGHALLTLSYTTLLAVGVMLAAYLITGFATPDSLGVLLVLMLESLVVLSLSLLGGTLMSTLANGVVVFMLYGVAFAGGWVEQIGSVLGSQTAVNIGIASSLLMPSEALWRYGVGLIQSSAGSLGTGLTPFSVASQPSNAFIVYSVLYVIALLAASTWSFSRRDF